MVTISCFKIGLLTGWTSWSGQKTPDSARRGSSAGLPEVAPFAEDELAAAFGAKPVTRVRQIPQRTPQPRISEFGCFEVGSHIDHRFGALRTGPRYPAGPAVDFSTREAHPMRRPVIR